MVSLAGSTVFSITANGCTGKALGPNKSCSVTVQYAPININGDTGTLTATGEHSSTGMNLYGNTSADLVLSPGTYLGHTDPRGYDYDHGPPFGSWSTTFTVTNNGSGASNTLTVAGCCHPQFVLSNNTCDGQALAPGGTCTFDLTFTAPGGCGTGDEFHTPLNILGNPSGDYIFLVAHGFCP